MWNKLLDWLVVLFILFTTLVVPQFIDLIGG